LSTIIEKRGITEGFWEKAKGIRQEKQCFEQLTNVLNRMGGATTDPKNLGSQVESVKKPGFWA
jgi:hypothetical protein